MEKYGFVYVWFDRYRKMYYVGSHWGTIDDGYICSSNRMRDAFRRRPHDFKRRIISTITTNRKDLLEKEHAWLQLIPKEQLGKIYYNLTKHHPGHWSATDSHLTTREKLSKAQIKRYSNPNAVKDSTRKLCSEASRKKIITEETRRKISESKKGKSVPKEQIDRLVAYNKGKPLSEEHKKKLSEKTKGRPGRKWTEEQKKAHSLLKQGTKIKNRKPVSEETRFRQSLAQKKRFQKVAINTKC